MSVILEPDFTLKIIQGDCGGFVVSDIPTDKNYHVYFQIRDRNNRPVGEQLMVESDGADFVEFYIDTELSDLLRVPFGRTFEPYTYGIKIYDPELEAEITSSLNGIFGKPNRLVVYPKQAEGPSGMFCNPNINIRPIDYKPHGPQREKEHFVTKTDMTRALSNKIDRSELEEISEDIEASVIESVKEDIQETIETQTKQIVESEMENYVTKQEMEEMSGVFFREI